MPLTLQALDLCGIIFLDYDSQVLENFFLRAPFLLYCYPSLPGFQTCNISTYL